MSKFARSARGEVVDFDLIAIKQQLAMKPVPVGVDERRRFIDEKDGLKSKQTPDTITEESVSMAAEIPSALSMSFAAAVESAAASEDAEDAEDAEDDQGDE